MLKLTDIMKRTVITISPECSVKNAVQRLIDGNVSSLMIATEDQRLVGVISEAALLPSVYDSQMRNDPVSLHMDRKFVAVSPEMSVDEAVNHFVLHRVNGFPVVEQGKIRGWVGRRDILNVLGRSPIPSLNAGGFPSLSPVFQ